MDGQASRKWGQKVLLIGTIGLMGIAAFAQEGRKVLVHPQPVYPELARGLALRGTVRLEVTVGADGEVKNTKPLGGHPLLVQATMDAVRKWKYAPSNAETTMTLEFVFKPNE